MKCLADSKNIILVLDAYPVPGVSMTVMVLISVDDGWQDWCWWLCKKRSTKWSHIKTSSNAIYITVSLIFVSILIAASSLTGCSRNARNPTVSLCHKNLKGHVPFQRCFNISISGSSLPIRLRIPRCMAPCANWSKWGPSFVIVNRWYLVILIQLVVVETKVAGDLKMVELLVNYDLLEKMCLHLVSNYDLVSHLLFVLRGATLGTKRNRSKIALDCQISVTESTKVMPQADLHHYFATWAMVKHQGRCGRSEPWPWMKNIYK